MADINNIRTLEDLTNVVSQLYFNLNKLDALYYDMFINPIPMTLELERYDENGELTTVQLDNRAKDRFQTLTGNGSPEGKVSASVGTFYIDLAGQILYFKGNGVNEFGWVQVSSGNLDIDPTTLDGSKIRNLNADNITSGLLKVARGGTEKGSLTGIVKGNGTNPFSVAVDGTDFIGPNTLTGIICYWPGDVVPNGWLVCNGQEVSKTTYSRLYSITADKYGASSDPNKFKLPNLIGRFVKGVASNPGATQVAAVGSHTHTHTLSAANADAEHSHTITGRPSVTTGAIGNIMSCRVFKVLENNDSYSTTTSKATHSHPITGEINSNGDNVKNTVDNISLIPIIKY